MKNNRIQVILPDDFIQKFEAERKKQGRSRSNFGWHCIMQYFASLKDQNEPNKSA